MFRFFCFLECSPLYNKQCRNSYYLSSHSFALHSLLYLRRAPILENRYPHIFPKDIPYNFHQYTDILPSQKFFLCEGAFSLFRLLYHSRDPIIYCFYFFFISITVGTNFVSKCNSVRIPQGCLTIGKRYIILFVDENICGEK